MLRLCAAITVACTVGSFAVAADSVVLGHGVSNEFLSQTTCAATMLCTDALYVWVIDADRTIVGPRVAGRVRAIFLQHTDARSTFVKSVELFVLRPLKDASLRKSYGADYSLVSLSPRYSEGRYCLSVKPSDVGLDVPASAVVVDAGRGQFCFPAAALASNNRWRGP